MAVTVFAAPILPGKTDAWKAAVAEMKGPRAEGHAESRRLHGVRREVACLQQTPMGDFVCVFMEADDPDTVMQREMESDHPFDRWFCETILAGCHGITPKGEIPPANELFLSWSA
jgi:hypothetical protein